MSNRFKKSLLVADLDVDYGQRIIQGYFSKFTPDPRGDLTRKGTFTKTVQERGPRQTPLGLRSKIKMGFNHGEVIGIPISIREDDTGAYFEGKVDETDLGDRVLTRVKSGSLDSCSFEYGVVHAQRVENDKSVRRILTEVKLYELGPVDYPLHEDASITGLKNQEECIGGMSLRLLELLQAKSEDYTDVRELKNLFSELKDLFGKTTVALEEAAPEAPLEEKGQPTGKLILEELTKFKLRFNTDLGDL